MEEKYSYTSETFTTSLYILVGFSVFPSQTACTASYLKHGRNSKAIYNAV